MESAERFTGCMLGGAVGDALGYLIEDMDLKTIHKKYGPYGLRTILKLASNDKKSVVSDDTQMALLTACFGLRTISWRPKTGYIVRICVGIIRRRNGLYVWNRQNG